MAGWWSLYIFAYLLACIFIWWAFRAFLLWLDRRQRRQIIYQGLRYGGRVPWQTMGAQSRANIRRA